MKEELYGLANHIAGAKGGLPQDWQDWANEIEMDLRKLANWEAQPVALVDRRPAASGGICWKNGGKDLPHGTELFTAPPAPALPPEATPEDIPQEHNINTYSGITWAEAWNACRAAMLNHVGDTNEKGAAKCECSSIDYCENCLRAMLTQPVSQGYTLPESWIPCSERMPDNDETKPIAIYTGKCLGQGMFVATYDEDGFFDYWEGSEIIGVTHWMPLPAAPEGGN